MAQQPQSQQQRAIPQSKEAQLKSYQKWLRDDIKSMMDNLLEIVKAAKLEEDTQVARPTQAEQDQYEMEVRAANIVRAGESLMKLISVLKQYLILNDFTSVNKAIMTYTDRYNQLQAEYDQKLLGIRDDMAVDLYDLEDEYYSSAYK